MPLLDITETGANGKAHNYSDVSTIATQIKTWANTTKLDYLNIQSDGLRVTGIRSHSNVEAGRIKVRNSTGGALSANALVYFSGTYNDGSNNYPTVAKAVSTQSGATTKYAQAILESAINNDADGTAVLVREVTSLDTSALNVGDRVWLSSTAGGYVNNLSDLPDVDFRSQVVGVVSVSSATVGRIVFGNWSIIPYSIAHEV